MARPAWKITEKQLAILRQLLAGQQNTEIAQAANVSKQVISAQVRAIRKKARVTNDVQLGVWAQRNGFKSEGT